MPTIPSKTYLPTADALITAACNFVTKHGDTITAVTAVISPSDTVAVAEAILAVQAACVVFARVHRIYDPNFGDTVDG